MFHLHSLPRENAQRGKRVPDAFGPGVGRRPARRLVAWWRAKWGRATPAPALLWLLRSSEFRLISWHRARSMLLPRNANDPNHGANARRKWRGLALSVKEPEAIILMTISLPITTSLPTERRPRPMGENHHQMASRARRGTNQRKFWVTPPRNIIARLPINQFG